jgi:cytochrome c biogenesis protein CcdA
MKVAVRQASQRRRAMAAAATVVVVLALAFGAGALSADPASAPNIAVERVSSWLSNMVSSVGGALPLGAAFIAGMASAFNPCGFPLLPAYLSVFLSEDTVSRGVGGRLIRAVTVGTVVTAGFVVLFAIAGSIVAAGSATLVTWMPSIGLGLGVLLVLAGGYAMSGGSVSTALPQRVGARIGIRGSGVVGYFSFGVTYGLASLSCTLPIFLAVVGTSLTGADPITAANALLVYALGMGTVIMTLTIATGLFKSALAARMRRLLPYVAVAGTVALFIAGGYIIYYWLTIGRLLSNI